MNIQWESGYAIRVALNGDSAAISANREGLRSLAGQLTALAEALPGSHIHLDAYNALEAGPAELIIERIEG